MSNCGISCLVCGKPGLFKVNHSGFHKLCQDHINTELSHSQCIICKSDVSIIYEFLKCSKCQECEVSFVCSCEDSFCSFCLKACQACNKRSCSDCLSGGQHNGKCIAAYNNEEKKASSSVSLGNSRMTEHGLCENCETVSIIKKKSGCDHKVCSKCAELPCTTCKLTRTIGARGIVKKPAKCRICKKESTELAHYKKLMICEKCKRSYFKNDQINHCENCAEPVDNASYNNENQYFSQCTHTGCPKCISLNQYCFKCLNKERSSKFSLNQGKCIFCQNNKKCFNLLCEHPCCISCLKEFHLAKLNYICGECIMKTTKYCLSCFNPALWIIEENKYLVRACCQDHKACSSCFGKIGLLWHSCKIKRNLK